MTKCCSFSLSHETNKQLTFLTKRFGVSRSELIRRLVADDTNTPTLVRIKEDNDTNRYCECGAILDRHKRVCSICLAENERKRNRTKAKKRAITARCVLCNNPLDSGRKKYCTECKSKKCKYCNNTAVYAVNSSSRKCKACHDKWYTRHKEQNREKQQQIKSEPKYCVGCGTLISDNRQYGRFSICINCAKDRKLNSARKREQKKASIVWSSYSCDFCGGALTPNSYHSSTCNVCTKKSCNDKHKARVEVNRKASRTRQNRKKQQLKRHKALTEGVCYECGSTIGVDGSLMYCATCLSKKSLLRLERTKRYKDQGLCPSCGKPKLMGETTIYCMNCTEETFSFKWD